MTEDQRTALLREALDAASIEYARELDRPDPFLGRERIRVLEQRLLDAAAAHGRRQRAVLLTQARLSRREVA